MKFTKLELTAFGSLTEEVFDFDVSRPVVHVVYGANEAGKSTTLRALTGLLFGIPHSTPDVHRHAARKLRVGAELESAAGARLHVQRRKGRKDTLLDVEGKPLGESVLGDFLHGLTRDRFEAMFALDHVRLREGAAEILAAGGDVGESLFDAGVGGPGVHSVLEQLERDSATIFTPRGRNQPLTAAIQRFRDAKRKARDATFPRRAWEEQVDALEREERALTELTKTQRGLREQKARIDRARRVRPFLIERDALLEQQRALGDGVPRLRAGFSNDRAAAQAAAQRGAVELASLAERLAEARAKLELFVVPERLTTLDDATIDRLQERLGAHRRVVAELPRQRHGLEAVEAEIAQLRRDLGPAVEAAEQSDPELSCSDGIEAFRLDQVTIRRLRTLAERGRELESRLSPEVLAQRRTQVKLDGQEQALKQFGEVIDVVELRGALGAAVGLGDAAQKLSERRIELASETAELRAEALALGISVEDFAVIRALAVPSVEVIEAFAQREADLAQRARAAAVQRSECGDELDRMDRDIAAERRTGAVPSEVDLDTARGQRNELWTAFRRDPVAGDADGFEQSLHATDGLADRLRREAHRVARFAELTARRDAVVTRLERADAEDSVLQEATEHLQRDWRALWASQSIEPRAPGEMRSWAARFVGLRGRIDGLRRGLAKTELEAEQVEGARRKLVSAIEATGGSADPDGCDLAGLIVLATQRCDDVAKSDRALERTETELQRLREEYHERAQQVAELETDLGSWQKEWQQALAAVRASGVSWSTGRAPQIDAVLGYLDVLDALFGAVDRAAAQRREIAAAEVDAAGFTDEIRELVRVHLDTAVPSSSLEEQAAELFRCYREARVVEAQRQQVEDEIVHLEQRSSTEREQERAANSNLLVLARELNTEDLDQLEVIEARALAAAKLDFALEENAARIGHADEVGETLETLMDRIDRAETSGQASARSAELEDELAELDERLGGHREAIGELNKGLEHIRDRGADSFATEAASHLAEVQAHAGRYVRLRLAAILLRREIERYRAENQQPILARASELFARLTIQTYVSIRVEFDERDEPTLRCIRRDESDVDVAGLSDGARDQLFLALRVASLECHAARDEPIPLVVDDVLIHFDDDRARAALLVLADLARSMQVLFFTHHRRLADLAREALGDQCAVHEFSTASAVARSGG